MKKRTGCPRNIVYLLVLLIITSILSACAQKNEDGNIATDTQTISNETLEADTKTEPPVITEQLEAEQPIQEETYAANEFSITELFIPEHPVLKDHFYRFIFMEEIKESCPEDYRFSSYESPNVKINYYMTEEIGYACMSNEEFEDSIDAFILLSGKYSLPCGIKIGSKESEITKYYPDVQIETKQEQKEYSSYGTGTWRFGNKTVSLPTLDFDKIYTVDLYYDLPEVKEYLREHGFSESTDNYDGGQSVLHFFVKDEKIVAIATGIPF